MIMTAALESQPAVGMQNVGCLVRIGYVYTSWFEPNYAELLKNQILVQSVSNRTFQVMRLFGVLIENPYEPVNGHSNFFLASRFRCFQNFNQHIHLKLNIVIKQLFSVCRINEQRMSFTDSPNSLAESQQRSSFTITFGCAGAALFSMIPRHAGANENFLKVFFSN